MLFKFLNLTGKTLSLRNAKTNKSKELVGTEGVQLFDCSQFDDDHHEFNCLSRYLVIQAINGSVINEPVWACIIPIPTPTANIQILYSTIGYSANKSTVIANYSCLDPNPQTLFPDSEIEVDPEYIKFKSLFIGLGQYVVDPTGKVSDIKEDVYLTIDKPEKLLGKIFEEDEVGIDINKKDEETAEKETKTATLIKVEDIDKFMDAQPLLSTSETFQLGIIILAIIIVCICIFILVISELKTHLDEIKNSKNII